MLYGQIRRDAVLRAGGTVAVLIFTIGLVGCDATRPFGETILDGLGTASKATVGGLETAGRAVVGSGQWVIDGGQTGIRGRAHGSTDKPIFLVTGLRFPGIKLGELSVLTLKAVDEKNNSLLWKQGVIDKTPNGPAMTIIIEPQGSARSVEVNGVLIYRNARWTLSARASVISDSADGAPLQWRTDEINVIRQ